LQPFPTHPQVLQQIFFGSYFASTRQDSSWLQKSQQPNADLKKTHIYVKNQRGTPHGVPLGQGNLDQVVRTLVGGIRYDDARDHACGDGGKNVVAVYGAPLVASGRTAQAILAVIDALAAIPVLMAHVVAPFPLAVLDVMMVVSMIAVAVTVVVVILGEDRAT
jgi:hypothetical protein